MLDYIEDLWLDFKEWTNFDYHWEHYTKERAVLHGLPFSAISACACAILFNCATPTTGVIFGMVNYITLTSLTEIIRKHHTITSVGGAILIAVSGAISQAFIQTICKTSMSYQTAILLTVAALAGQIARPWFEDLISG